MTCDDHGVAIVIPAFNHALTVVDVADQARRYSLPILVVDDGSTDETPARLSEMADLCVCRHEANLGKGAAILTGSKYFAGKQQSVLTIDADLQHDPTQIPDLVAAAKANPTAIVVGKRMGMHGDQKVPWTSRFGRLFSNFWVRACGGPRLSDSQSGFRVYPIAFLQRNRFRAARYQFEVEVLVKAGWSGMDVIEIPITVNYQPPGGRISHFRPFLDFLRNSRTFSGLFFLRIFVPSFIRRKWTS